MFKLTVAYGSWDAQLSKIIPRVAIIALVLHVMTVIKTSSNAVVEWSVDPSTNQYSEAFPSLSSQGVDELVPNSVSYTNTSNITHILQTSDPSIQSDVHAPTQVHRIPLDELINNNPNVTCNPGLSGKRLIQSTTLAESFYYVGSNSTRKIPKLVHVTSKTRCMTPQFLQNLDKWRFEGYGFYFHDESAVDRLLSKYWPEFPHLQLLQHCMISGASKADLWRLLILWEYGGIYTDIDNAPAIMFQQGAAIQDDDEAWFVVERLGILSQCFMAAEPRHPFIYISILVLLERLLEVPNIQKQYVPSVTGPGALKVSTMSFLKIKEEKIKEGKYVGVGNKTLTVVGKKGHANDYILRESASGIQKKGGYFAMGMVHFASKDKTAPTESCYEFLHKITSI